MGRTRHTQRSADSVLRAKSARRNNNKNEEQKKMERRKNYTVKEWRGRLAEASFFPSPSSMQQPNSPILARRPFSRRRRRRHRRGALFSFHTLRLHIFERCAVHSADVSLPLTARHRTKNTATTPPSDSQPHLSLTATRWCKP